MSFGDIIQISIKFTSFLVSRVIVFSLFMWLLFAALTSSEQSDFFSNFLTALGLRQETVDTVVAWVSDNPVALPQLVLENLSGDQRFLSATAGLVIFVTFIGVSNLIFLVLFVVGRWAFLTIKFPNLDYVEREFRLGIVRFLKVNGEESQGVCNEFSICVKRAFSVSLDRYEENATLIGEYLSVAKGFLFIFIFVIVPIEFIFGDRSIYFVMLVGFSLFALCWALQRAQIKIESDLFLETKDAIRSELMSMIDKFPKKGFDDVNGFLMSPDIFQGFPQFEYWVEFFGFAVAKNHLDSGMRSHVATLFGDADLEGDPRVRRSSYIHLSGVEKQ